jgi:hypothetical protein
MRTREPELKRARTPEDARARLEAHRQKEAVDRFNVDHRERQAWWPSSLADLQSQRADRSRRESSERALTRSRRQLSSAK